MLFDWLKKKQSINTIVMLVDLENLILNLGSQQSRVPSLSDAFDSLISQLTPIGRITDVFVFGPLHAISLYLEVIYKYGFYAILCPKLKDKKSGPDIDTVDATIMDFGAKVIPRLSGITHLCLASGDKDFSRFLRTMRRHGLRIAIASGNVESLAMDLIEIADKNPMTGKKMVFPISPENSPSSV